MIPLGGLFIVLSFIDAQWAAPTQTLLVLITMLLTRRNGNRTLQVLDNQAVVVRESKAAKVAAETAVNVAAETALITKDTHRIIQKNGH